MKHLRLIVSLLAVAIAVTIVGVALASRGNPLSTKRHQARPHATRIHQGDHSGTVRGRTDSESNDETESNVESERGQAGEPAGGHEDPAGVNIDHQCTGDCVE